MTRDKAAAHFEALGMSTSDAISRAELVWRVEEGFRAANGAGAEWSGFVPGRIEIFGKHTDYAGGHSLVAAAPRGFGMAARRRADSRVRLVDLRYGESVEVDAASDRKPSKGFGAYAHVVARRFALNFPGAELGIDLAIASDLPRAAGVSSSSALVVGVASALAWRAGLAGRAEWQAHIRSVEDLAWYLGCVENGLDYPGLPGTAGVGTMGGSEDHTAILACRANHVSRYRFVPVSRLGDAVMPAGWTFVVATSGVQADKAGSVRDRYNRASLGTRALLDIWNARADTRATSLGDALACDDAREQLESWLASAEVAGFTADDLRRRLRHFADENARVHAAGEAFARADAPALGDLARGSQRDAEVLLGNQIPETSALVEAAHEAGAWASSNFGAGFGGSAWALVPSDGADRFAREWVRAQLRRVGLAVEAFVAHPGPPMTALPR